MEVEKDYPGATVVKLEQNYRSTPEILAAAHSVIKRNRFRKEKKLWTTQAGGEPVRFQAGLVELHQYLPLPPSADLDVGHSLDALERGLELVVGELTEFLRVEMFRGKGQDQDGGLVLVVAGDHGLFDLPGELALDAREALLHLESRPGGVRARLEYQSDDGPLLARDRDRIVEIGQGGHLVLHRFGHQGLDVLRRQAAPDADEYGEHPRIRPRHEVHRHPEE